MIRTRLHVTLLLAAAASSFAQSQNSAWPREAVADSIDARLLPSRANEATTSYASAHFEITSELRLPLGVVRDLAAVFEATRAAVRAVPLGFGEAPEPKAYPVRLCATPQSYAQAGGSTGTGGTFNGREMLVLLPNIGIQAKTNGLGMEHTQHLFVLKHEVSHQLMAPARIPLPMWLNEGLAETFAATPYVRGRYTFSGLDSAMRDYVLKWRRSPDQRTVRLVAPGTLMRFSPGDWQGEVTAQRAYDLYNSAALLTHWYLHHDGAGDGVNLRAYLGALRERQRPEEAEAQHLLRGRTAEQIGAEVRAMARRMALQVE